MGDGLKCLPDRVFLMTRVCTHRRDKALFTAHAQRILASIANRLDLRLLFGFCSERIGAAGALERAKGRNGPVVGFPGIGTIHQTEDAGDRLSV